MTKIRALALAHYGQPGPGAGEQYSLGRR